MHGGIKPEANEFSKDFICVVRLCGAGGGRGPAGGLLRGPDKARLPLRSCRGSEISGWSSFARTANSI